MGFVREFPTQSSAKNFPNEKILSKDVPLRTARGESVNTPASRETRNRCCRVINVVSERRATPHAFAGRATPHHHVNFARCFRSKNITQENIPREKKSLTRTSCKKKSLTRRLAKGFTARRIYCTQQKTTTKWSAALCRPCLDPPTGSASARENPLYAPRRTIGLAFGVALPFALGRPMERPLGRGPPAPASAAPSSSSLLF